MQQHQEAGSARKQVVYAAQLVRATPFYGYHPSEKIFVKVILYNPGQITRVATLLQVTANSCCTVECSELLCGLHMWQECQDSISMHPN